MLSGRGTPSRRQLHGWAPASNQYGVGIRRVAVRQWHVAALSGPVIGHLPVGDRFSVKNAFTHRQTHKPCRTRERFLSPELEGNNERAEKSRSRFPAERSEPPRDGN
jgi:hypothetical protein